MLRTLYTQHAVHDKLYVSLTDHCAYLFAACFDLCANYEQILLCTLLRLPLDDDKLTALFSQVKNCGLVAEEQQEYFQLWLDEMDDDDRAIVQELIRSGKTVLEAINSFRGRRNGR
jgi:hypothetical protein